MNIRLLTGSGLAVAVVVFFTVNVLSHVAFRSARVDLTEQRLYTSPRAAETFWGASMSR